MKILSVNATTPYDVVIAQDFTGLKEKITEVFKGKLAVVFDTHTHILFSEEINERLKDFDLYEVVLPAGENTKNINCYIKLLSFLAENNFTRKDGILAIGGGVIGDLCGFVASTYMRGIAYISCPTTLLSCVDSSIGGKTAVNLPQGKNLVGAFYQPKLVYISLSSLNSLPQREVECGMGEVVKYAFLDNFINEKDIKGGISQELILKCLQIKKKVVEQDEFDLGERAKLNLGHTVGHAIESLSEFEYSHGLCVFNGMRYIIDISCKYYGYGEDKKAEFLSLLNAYPYTETVNYTVEELIEKIKIDKKAETGAVNLVLIKEIGKTEIVKMPLETLKEMLK